MNVLNKVLSLITVVCAVVGLFGFVSYDFTMPIMLVSFGTLLLVRAIQYKQNGNNQVFTYSLIGAIFLYGVVIYNLFIA